MKRRTFVQSALGAAFTASIPVEQLLPVPLQLLGDPCVTVSRQIYEALTLPYTKEIDQLRSPGGFSSSGEISPIQNCIDGTGLARVRTPRESDFRTHIFDKLIDTVSATQEVGLWIFRHTRWSGGPMQHI